jgi:membrane associated rhomboid family serine protease
VPGGDLVLRVADRRTAADAALVLSAKGIPHRVMRTAGEHLVIVPAAAAEAAAAELSDFRQENVGFGRREPPFRAATGGVAAAAAWGLALALVFVLERGDVGGLDWLRAGASDAARIRAGELWRPFTALTLHVDLVHLVSNLVFGGLFGVLLAQAVGAGRAWLGFVLAGALGNLVNALLHAGGHVSVGASTGVFALIGMLATVEWKRRGESGSGRIRRWAPFLGAATLLGLLGVGDAAQAEASARQTVVDVPAHLFGLAAGLLLGLLARPAHRGTLPPAEDRLLLALAPGLVVVAWLVAFLA